MKKLIVSILALCMMMTALTACGSSGKAEGSSAEAPASYSNMLEEVKGTGKIVMAVSPDFAPYEFVDLTKEGPDSYVGADIELGKYIAEKLGVELEIKTMDFEAIQAAVSSKSVNMAISALAYSDERAESMGLSVEYKLGMDEDRGVLVPVDKVDEYATAEDFSGKTIAVQNGTLQYDLVTSQLPSDVNIKLIGSMKDGVLMLTGGKVDGVAASSTYAQNYPEIALSKFLFDYTTKGNVVAVPKGEDALLEEINSIIEELNQTNTYGQWVEDATALAESLGIETN